MNTLDIKKTVQRAVKGEQSAFAELYAMSYNKVYFYAYRMLQNKEDAIDIVQETFITVFTKIGELKKPESYMCWLSKITVNLCRDFSKKSARLVIDRENADLIDRIADEDNSTEDIVLGNDTREYLIKVIDALPEEQKRAVLLYYYEQLTIAQIAEIEETTVSAIKNRLLYARKKIKKAIAFEETKCGTKLFAFGVPAVAVLLSQCASACPMPINAVREVFVAAMAVANLNYSKKGFDFAGFEYEQKGFGSVLKNRLLFQIRPVYIICIAAVIFVALAGLVIPELVTARRGADASACAYTEIPVEIVQKKSNGDMVTIRTRDIPQQIMQNTAYCSFNASAGESAAVTPERAYLRTVYGDRQSLDTAELTFRFYQKTMLIVSFYDDEDTMTGYTYVNYGTSINWPDYINFMYDFDIDQEKILSDAVKLAGSMMSDAAVIDENDVYCKTDKNNDKSRLMLKNPDITDDTEYMCCIWTDSSQNHKEIMTRELASNFKDESSLKGSRVFDSNTPAFIDYMQDKRYCLIALIGGGRVTYAGYIDCSRVEEVTETREQKEQ